MTRFGCPAEETLSANLDDVAMATIKSAAMKLTGFARRQFQAEVANTYCDGNPCATETL